MFEMYLEGSIEPDDIPNTREPVYILGKKYNAVQGKSKRCVYPRSKLNLCPELDIIRQDILSKVWFTYRKNFVPIGGDEGLTTDKGWGCMLRCGQMVLAQALISLHLGKWGSWI